MTATNEQAKEVLAQLMQRALDGVDAAVDFSQRQIPQVIEQLLTWHLVESLLFFCLGVSFIVSALFALRKLKGVRARAIVDRENGEAWTRFANSSELTSGAYDFAATAVFYVPIIPAFVGILILMSNLTWLKIWLAPKLYLLEYGASLVK